MKAASFIKFKLKIIFSRRKYFKYLFAFGFTLAFSIFSVVIGTQSNQANKYSIASLISSSAKTSSSNFLNLNFTSLTSHSVSDYNKVFNLASSIRNLNFNRTGYQVFSGFNQNDVLFSSKFSYKIENQELSILSSYFNSINFYDGHYTHEIWGGDYLFKPGQFSVNEQDTNFCFIPTVLADRLLIENSLDDYSSLLGKSLKITYVDKENSNNSRILSWTIANVFRFDKTSTYLYRQFGNYICCYYPLPSYECGSINIQFGISEYTNCVYLDWFKKNINLDDYSISVNFGCDADFDVAYFEKRYFNDYWRGIPDSIYFTLLFGFGIAFTCIEIVYLFKMRNLNSLATTLSSVLGLCVGSAFVYILPVAGLWLSPASIYSSVIYFASFLIIFFIVREVKHISRKADCLFENDTFHI